MPNSAFKAIFSAEMDRASFERETAEILAASRAAERKLSTPGTAVGGGFGGFLSRSRVAGSMFTSVARDAAASLASGAPVSQVIMQQLPQVLQAFTFMGINLKLLGVYAAGAGIAMLTLTKAAEAYAAKQQEKASELELAFTLSSNRSRLLGLLEQNKFRLPAGEADALTKKLNKAIAGSVVEDEAVNDNAAILSQDLGGRVRRKMADMQRERKRASVEAVESEIRERLKTVQLGDKQKKQMSEIADIAYKARIDALEGDEKQRRIADEKYRKTVAEIKEREGFAKTEADHALVQYAYRQAALAHEKELADIGKRDPKRLAAISVTDRQRIGAFSASSPELTMIDISRQSLKVQTEMRDKISRLTGPDNNGSF